MSLEQFVNIENDGQVGRFALTASGPRDHQETAIAR
jgi:hypothetical protein